MPGRGQRPPSSLCLGEAALNLVVFRDSAAAAARARSGLSHDLGASKLEKETDPNFLPLESKQNVKARVWSHRQRWRLSGGCLNSFPGRGPMSRPSCPVS